MGPGIGDMEKTVLGAPGKSLLAISEIYISLTDLRGVARPSTLNTPSPCSNEELSNESRR
jgi:hypothetical protein